MIYLITSILLILGSVTGFILGKKFTKKSILLSLSKGTGKMGVIRYKHSYKSIFAYIEVEELETAGKLTKVIIHDVIIDRASAAISKEKVLAEWGGNDWVNTIDVIWYNNNSQKIRDIKINEILK